MSTRTLQELLLKIRFIDRSEDQYQWHEFIPLLADLVARELREGMQEKCKVHGDELPCRECMGLEILRLQGKIP